MLSGAQGQGQSQWAQTKVQETMSEHKTDIFLLEW